MKIVKNFVAKSKYNIKCPYTMKPTRIVVHNTANDASARNEIAYMIGNNNEVSYHYAVDDIEVVQGIPENRNAWHASDGNGKGNREGIGIEICYSESGGDRFIKAEQNAVKLIVDILNRYKWGIDKVTKHQDYCTKYCPHRTLDMGWDRFIKMIEAELDEKPKTETKPTETPKTTTAIKVGDKVKVNKGAKDYSGKTISSFVFNNTYTVDNLVGDRAVLDKKGICTAFKVKDLTLVKASAETKPSVKCFTKYNGKSTSIVTALNEIGAKSTFAYRTKIAKANNIKLYVGTAKQNTTMLNLLKQGKLIKP